MKTQVINTTLFLAMVTVAAFTSYTLAASVNTTFSGDRVTVSSSKSFEEANGAIESLVAQNGMMIMAQVNQGKMLSMTGLRLNSTLYLIGNPTVGKQLFEQDHGVGLYIPLRILVYSREDGTTLISYDKASALLSQYKNDKISAIAAKLDQKLESLATMAAQ